MTLEQQLPLKMQETSFTERSPHRAQRMSSGRKIVPRRMYFERKPLRPSDVYAPARRYAAAVRTEQLPDERRHDRHNMQRHFPRVNNTSRTAIEQAHKPSQRKTVNATIQSDTSPGRPGNSKTNEDFTKYIINESETRELVTRVLNRARDEADKG